MRTDDTVHAVILFPKAVEHPDTARAVSFSCDGKRVAVGSGQAGADLNGR